MGRKVGIVASGTSEIASAVILNEGEEKRVKTEDLVLVRNKSGNQVLAVCRGGLGLNDNLRIGPYSPGVAYAKMGHRPSDAKEFYAFNLSMIGDVTNALQQNKLVIAPLSEVEIFEDSDNPMKYLGDQKLTVGYYKEHPTWRVSAKGEFLSYHLGVFGVTGSGKSYLARFELIPLLRKAGYDVIIFDWKGSDMCPTLRTLSNSRM